MKQSAHLAKKRFIVRQVLIFGGLPSLLGISSLYHRHFGWHLGFDFYFLVRGLALLVSQIALWFLVSLWMWSRTPEILKHVRKKRVSRA